MAHFTIGFGLTLVQIYWTCWTVFLHGLWRFWFASSFSRSGREYVELTAACIYLEILCVGLILVQIYWTCWTVFLHGLWRFWFASSSFRSGREYVELTAACIYLEFFEIRTLFDLAFMLWK